MNHERFLSSLRSFYRSSSSSWSSSSKENDMNRINRMNIRNERMNDRMNVL